MTGVILNTWLLFHVSGLCSLITHAHTHGSLLEQMKSACESGTGEGMKKQQPDVCRYKPQCV